MGLYVTMSAASFANFGYDHVISSLDLDPTLIAYDGIPDPNLHIAI